MMVASLYGRISLGNRRSEVSSPMAGILLVEVRGLVAVSGLVAGTVGIAPLLPRGVTMVVCSPIEGNHLILVSGFVAGTSRVVSVSVRRTR